MILWQILVPVKANNGKPYSTQAAFLSAVLSHCGGYTVIHGTAGMWRDPETGKVYPDDIVIVQFATGHTGPIKLAFSRCFPDQKCLMLTRIGEAEFIDL